jgi:protein N-terminal glutamine amidohydrolase
MYFFGLVKQMKYCPYYCEENIWHLCQNESLLSHTKKVVFISNQNRCVAMRHQRAGGLVHWDYHVVLLFKQRTWKIADFDTLLPFPCPAAVYLSESFISTEAPFFCVVDADQYIRDFASDRRHMIDQEGTYLKSPPPWNAIGAGFNLWEFVDGKYGQVYGVNEMNTAFS